MPTGTVVGAYALIAEVARQPGRNVYLAQVASEDETPPSGKSEPYLCIIEAPQGTIEAIRRMEALQLRHPRLLALRDFYAIDNREYAVIDIPGNMWPVPPPAPLSPEEALAVGVIIGEVVIFLHGRGVMHGHLTQNNIVIAPNGVFLAGIEDATIVGDQPTISGEHFAQDANQLAQVIGTYCGPDATASPIGEAAAAIVQRGAANGFERVQDVIAECLRALPDGLPKLSEEALHCPLTMEIGHATTVGLVRQQNQDSLGMVVMEIIDDQPEASPGGIFVVADGMGGEAQGEVASRIAARLIVAEVARRFLGPTARATATDTAHEEVTLGEAATMMHVDSIAALTEAFRAANARIRNMARRLEQATGTTATALMLFGHDALIGHVGDSRAYLCRSGELVQLTHDHSLVQKLIDMGQYRPEEAEYSMPRNYLYRSLGQTDELEVDTRVVKIGAGDTFMICSDGLWDLVPDAVIRDLMASDRSAMALAQELTIRANAAGGHDNSTALVVRFVARIG